jgi:hypothetical protein
LSDTNLKKFEVAGIPHFLRWRDTVMEGAQVQVRAFAVLCNCFESLWSCSPCPALRNPVAFSINFVNISVTSVLHSYAQPSPVPFWILHSPHQVWYRAAPPTAIYFICFWIVYRPLQPICTCTCLSVSPRPRSLSFMPLAHCRRISSASPCRRPPLPSLSSRLFTTI